MRKLSLATALLCAMAVTPLMLSAPVVAQAPPAAQNVIPDGISYATQGKLQALDPGAGTLTIAPENIPPMPMTVAPGVSLGDLAVGDVASVHYTRTVSLPRAARMRRLKRPAPRPWDRWRKIRLTLPPVPP